MEGVRGSGDCMEAAAVAVVLPLALLVGLAGSRGSGSGIAKFPTGRGTRLGCKTLQRTRRSVEAIFGEIGATTVRRMYRMTPESFCAFGIFINCWKENWRTQTRGKGARHPMD